MLHLFLSSNRTELIARCRAKVALRPAREARDEELEHGITLFLDQLIKTLKFEQTAEPIQSRRISGAPNGKTPDASEIGESAAKHGWELLQHGFSIDQVVRDYGDLCQAITQLAFERGEPIAVEEFETLNRCLDNATADAVTEFTYQRDSQVAERHSKELNERLGFFAHELRNLITSAMLAQSLIKSGDVALNGATGAVLDRSLVGMRNLIDRSLADVRISAETPVQHQLFSLAEFITEVKITAGLESPMRLCVFSVSEVDPHLWVDADRDLLFSALGNLLQNAFKFTRLGSEVTLGAHASGARILIDVEDCGPGLPEGEGEKMFLPFTQAGEDRSGLGLGLSIAKRSVEANEGTLRVRNKIAPDSGCVFTIDLPRHSAP